MNDTDRLDLARRAYATGDVTLAEFEEWVASILRGDVHEYDAVDPATGGYRMEGLRA